MFLPYEVDWSIGDCLLCFLPAPDHPFLAARPAFVPLLWVCGALLDRATNSHYRPFGAVKPLDYLARPVILIDFVWRGYRAVCFSCRARPVTEHRYFIVLVARF